MTQGAPTVADIADLIEIVTTASDTFDYLKNLLTELDLDSIKGLAREETADLDREVQMQIESAYHHSIDLHNELQNTVEALYRRRAS